MFEELGKSLDNLLHTLAKDVSVTRIDPRTEPVVVEYPATRPTKLRLEVGIGTLKIEPGADKLVEGSITYNVEEWKPQVLTDGGSITIKQEHAWPLAPSWDELKNDWALKLGTAHPFDLSILKGVSRGDLSLGGVPLSSATVDIGTGETSVDFTKPNPEVADHVSFRTGTGAVELVRLLNTNAKYVSVDSGTGKVYLDFTGEALKQDMTVKVNVGTGEVIISVQKNTPARVSLTQGFGSVVARGGFKAVANHVYEAGNYGPDGGPKITFNVQAGMGSVTLTTLTDSDSTRILG